MLRSLGLTPTIQRLAVLECVSKTDQHPSADQILAVVRKRFPSISRATVYNTLDALTKAGVILRLTVDPAVARYDADLQPHVHFHCRVCGRIYDLEIRTGEPLEPEADGHLIESLRTYAYGVCASCRERASNASRQPSRSDSDRKKGSEAPSSPVPPQAAIRSDRKKGSETPSSPVPPQAAIRPDRKKGSETPSSPVPPQAALRSDRKKGAETPSSPVPPQAAIRPDRKKGSETPSSPVPDRPHGTEGARNA